MAYINRAIENTLKNRFETSKAVAIAGARQVGKTTMTKHIYSDIGRINLKNVVLYNNAKEDPQGFLGNFERPIFIDEVQMVPELIGLGLGKTIIQKYIRELTADGIITHHGSKRGDYWEVLK